MRQRWSTNKQDPSREHDNGGFIDLITLIFVSFLVLVALIPFVIGTVQIVVLKQELDQSAWNILRAATVEGASIPSSVRVDGKDVNVSLQGSLQGCSVNRLTLRTNTTLPGLSILGRSISNYQVTGSATIAVGGYRRVDNEGINCGPIIQGS